MCPVTMEIALTSPALLHASSCLLLFLGWQQLFQPLRFSCPHIPGAAEHSPAQPGGMTRDGGWGPGVGGGAVEIWGG